jgi:protein-tyrosine-phosphatase
MLSILIVCTANICRSPMAEAILKHLVSERPDATQWHIESAGTWAISGCRAAELSQYVMQTMGMDIGSHRSQPVSLDLIRKFDLILTMENNHKEGMMAEFHSYADRIFMLSEMVGLTVNITDPIGGKVEDYVETANSLNRIISEGVERIFQLATINKNRHEGTR